MDRFIKDFAAIADDADEELILCLDNGVAYQRDMTRPVEYGSDYFEKYVSYEGLEIARKINHARVRLVNRHVGPATRVLDIGIGSGEFIKSRPNTYGCDVNPVACQWLEDRKLLGAIVDFNVFSLWDVIEHLPEPENYFNRMRSGAFLFTCLPIFDALSDVRGSKHFRPNEHFYYWTANGFIDWMNLHKFDLVMLTNDETEAGREQILSFAFKKR